MWTAALLLGMVALASGGPLDTSAYGSAPAPSAPSYSGATPAPPTPSYASSPTFATPQVPTPASAASYSSPPSPSYANPSPPAASYGSAPAGPAQPAYGGGNNYGQKCKTVYETVQTDKCEAYTEKVCYTTQQESCVDVPDQNCRAITSSQQIRQCFNVTELKCGLKEDVQYETVQAVFTVQKCHTVTERVCDTVYETVDSSKDDYQCINVRNSVCSMADQNLVDKTCKTTTKFDCGYGGGYGDDASGGYGSGAVQAGGYGGGYECKRSFNTQCYNTPRVVNTEKCYPKDQQICEKLVNLGPQPKEKQVCHNEEKKICELEQRSQPKQIKKYVYTTACKSVPRSVCDSAEIKRLVPSCVPITRKYCTYSPVEKCEEIPKQYCYKVPSKVPKQKCYNQGYGEGGSNEETYEAS